MLEIKEYIAQATGLSHDVLHVHVGLALYLCARVIFQGRGGAIVSFSLIVVIALLGEMSDFVINDGVLSSREPDHLADIIGTCFWPMMLCGISLLDLRDIRVSLPATQLDRETQPRAVN
ncbi:hypothetical protein MBESOW_P3462 [Sphingobium xenophagum]|uniref:Uncharacterized protein n=1 Tax=Sphingobium xenophagum TaxID=121428 RepID=A0A401J6H1_SPHXE|nr:hypothetical protein MBESOW_P3462 [Sphingobium xenophagum]